MKKLLIVLSAIAVLFIGIWPIAIPESLIKDIVEGSLKHSGLTVETEALRKGLFFSFSSDRMTIKKAGNPLISIDDFAAGISPLSLLTLKPSIHFRGGLGNGTLEGSANIFQAGGPITLSVKGAQIDGIPFFSSIGMDGTGDFSGELSIKNSVGDAKFRLKDARLKNSSFSGIMIPMEMFNDAKGAISIDHGTIKIVAFSMEGDGIYARLSGYVKGNTADMLMELMPQKSFIEKNPVMLMLGSYRDSPGHYAVPVKTTMPF